MTPNEERRLWQLIDRCAGGKHQFAIVGRWYETSVNTDLVELKIEWWCSWCGQKRSLSTGVPGDVAIPAILDSSDTTTP